MVGTWIFVILFSFECLNKDLHQKVFSLYFPCLKFKMYSVSRIYFKYIAQLLTLRDNINFFYLNQARFSENLQRGNYNRCHHVWPIFLYFCLESKTSSNGESEKKMNLVLQQTSIYCKPTFRIIFPNVSFHKHCYIQFLEPTKCVWGALVAQSVKGLTLDLGSGHDVTVHEINPSIRLCADSTERDLDSLSRSLSACPLLTLSLSLSLCFSLSLSK